MRHQAKFEFPNAFFDYFGGAHDRELLTKPEILLPQVMKLEFAFFLLLTKMVDFILLPDVANAGPSNQEA